MATGILYILIIDLHLPIIRSVDYGNGDINSPFTLNIDDGIYSYNSLVRLKMQSEGNLVLRSRLSTSESWNSVWDTNTDTNNGHRVTLQNDGELVVFDASESILWTSNSLSGTAPFRLIVSDDIAVYILDAANVVVWSTNPTFLSLETIWADTFDSNNGWDYTGNINLPSTSANCPNYPDNCVEITTLIFGINSDIAKNTVISMYSAIQFQVDIKGDDIEQNAYCAIYWEIDNGGWQLKTHYKYQNEVYRDIIYDIPLPASYTSISIALEVEGDSTSDKCYFDNAILRGIMTPSPTIAPTTTQAPTNPTSSPTPQPTPVPTKAPTPAPTTFPTVSPTNNPTDTTTSPTQNPTPAPTDYPTPYPTRTPTTAEPTTNPTPAPTTVPTPSPTDHPTTDPSPEPTNVPSPSPTDAPTDDPTPAPTNIPTASPTDAPTLPPTHNPTPSPTNVPSPAPTTDPTPVPTYNPTSSPTKRPILGASLPTQPQPSTTTTKPSQQPTAATVSADSDENVQIDDASNTSTIIRTAIIIISICTCGIIVITAIMLRRLKRQKEMQTTEQNMNIQTSMHHDTNIAGLAQGNVMASSVPTAPAVILESTNQYENNIQLDDREYGDEGGELEQPEDFVTAEGPQEDNVNFDDVMMTSTPMTPQHTQPNIAPDEFIIGGDDDDDILDTRYATPGSLLT